jgi:hypothetical protein
MYTVNVYLFLTVSISLQQQPMHSSITHALNHSIQVSLPDANSIRLAQKEDAVPPEQPFPTSTRWDGEKDPAETVRR